ncbi:MAG: Bro-N domain-containing protein [Bacteroidaceae bacterium]|nr:Bro-N domain-containing protein [Bacteroidaceae bacterium]
MSLQEAFKQYGDRPVRVVWDDETEEWYFSVVDVVGVLTESINPTDYLKKIRKRDPELHDYVGTNCPQILMTTESGRRRKTLAGTTEQVLRIIQSIPSPKAEPFKRWMANVASQRLNQLQNPELSIDQAVADYRRLGYSESWINQRMKTIEVRKQLTDEWQRGGVEGQQYAALTDIITRTWSGHTTREYKHLKGLHKENLRDNTTNVELLLNALAEASTTELSKAENPKGYNAHARVAQRGGGVAKAARNQLEAQLGRSVVTSLNARDYLKGLEDNNASTDADAKEIE